jgi:transposase
VLSFHATVMSRPKRNRVERLFNRLKQHRAIATRYDKLAEHYCALLTRAATPLWL